MRSHFASAFIDTKPFEAKQRYLLITTGRSGLTSVAHMGVLGA